MKRLLTSFWHDTRAAVALEAVLLFPILAAAWVGSFAYFDAYRTYNTSVKATYTIADLLSRQLDIVEVDDMEGYALMLEAMIRGAEGLELRVTQILSDDDGNYSVDWSYAGGTLAQLATPNMEALEDRLPGMAGGERVLLIESFIDYNPTFGFGLADLEFENFTLTRPRYANQVRYDDGTTVFGTDHDDNAT